MAGQNSCMWESKYQTTFQLSSSNEFCHGRQNTIEGEVKPDLTAVVIEDLVSTGGSSLKAVEELKKNGVIVKGLVSIFSYGFDTATENFKKAACPFYSLCNYDILLKQALTTGYIKEGDLELLQDWRKDPANWKK